MNISNKFAFLLFCFFVLGLMPYFYIPIAARSNAIINWNKADNLKNFIRLITRADYGSFLSGPSYASEMIDRFLQIRAYYTFFLHDFNF